MKVYSILHDEDFELSRLKWILRLFEDSENMVSPETENRVEMDEFIKDEISIRLWQITMYGELYKRGVLDVLRQ